MKNNIPNRKYKLYQLELALDWYGCEPKDLKKKQLKAIEEFIYLIWYNPGIAERIAKESEQ